MTKERDRTAAAEDANITLVEKATFISAVPLQYTGVNIEQKEKMNHRFVWFSVRC